MEISVEQFSTWSLTQTPILITAAINPLTNEHVLVSPHRTKRPWLGQTEAPQTVDLPSYDPACYLCPGNSRSGGEKNPVYQNTHTFVNDFSALLPAPTPATPLAPHPLLTASPIHGACDVLIFHPRHDLTPARLQVPDIERIVAEWIRIYQLRGSQEGIKYVQIFENNGAMMGCSNPHPHGQVWSMSEIPTLPATELASLRRYAASEAPTSDAPRGPKGICPSFLICRNFLKLQQEMPACCANTHMPRLVCLKQAVGSSSRTTTGLL
ncbi:hypothetical protein C0991_003738 [Blastosporella zonata]|nr:hypothetical protein C0991_003738 [Blastosporella zonata]